MPVAQQSPASQPASSQPASQSASSAGSQAREPRTSSSTVPRACQKCGSRSVLQHSGRQVLPARRAQESCTSRPQALQHCRAGARLPAALLMLPWQTAHSSGASGSDVAAPAGGSLSRSNAQCQQKKQGPTAINASSGAATGDASQATHHPPAHLISLHLTCRRCRKHVALRRVRLRLGLPQFCKALPRNCHHAAAIPGRQAEHQAPAG